MKNKLLSVVSGVVATLVLATGCATSKAKQTQAMLSDSGFKLVQASTPEQQQELKTLPTGKVSLVKRKGQTYYVYPDHAEHALYVGRSAEYQAYQNAVQSAQTAKSDEKVAASVRGEKRLNEDIENQGGYATESSAAFDSFGDWETNF